MRRVIFKPGVSAIFSLRNFKRGSRVGQMSFGAVFLFIRIVSCHWGQMKDLDPVHQIIFWQLIKPTNKKTAPKSKPSHLRQVLK